MKLISTFRNILICIVNTAALGVLIVITGSGSALFVISAFLLFLDNKYMLTLCASIIGALLAYCYVKLGEKYDV